MRRVMMAEIINTLNHFAKEQPDKIAVRHIEDVLTYKELDEASSKLAHQLQDGKNQWYYMDTCLRI